MMPQAELRPAPIHYLVTSEGIDLIARRSYRYLRRTVGHVVRYKERMLESLLGQAGLELSRRTDVDSPAAGANPDAFVIADEAVPRMRRAEDEPWDLHLAELVNQIQCHAKHASGKPRTNRYGTAAEPLRHLLPGRLF